LRCVLGRKPLKVAELDRRAKKAWQLQQCLQKNLPLFDTGALFLWIGITGTRVDSGCNQFLACKHWLERKLASAISFA
jgi:hypothetical protein